MEPDLYFYCPDCGREVAVHPDTVPTLREGIRVVSNVCECGHVAKARFADCTTERRTPAVEVSSARIELAHDDWAERDTGVSTHDSGATVNGTFSTETRGDYATAPVYKCNSKECGGLSLESGLFEGLCACGASVTEVRDVSKDQYRRMCAQADEIRALQTRIAILIGDAEELTIQRDTAIEARDATRAEVERLKRSSAMDESGYKGEIAMLKAEREKARADVRRLKEDERGLLADNAALRAEVERLKGEEWRTGIVREENAALRARIAALEAVIKAQTTYNTAALDLRDAWDAAGLDASVVTGARVTEDK